MHFSAHNLAKETPINSDFEEFRERIEFEGLISEAQGPALLEDAPQTLACYRATAQLAKLYKLPRGTTWDELKAYRATLEYGEMCRVNMAPTKIQCILIDDGLGVVDLVYPYNWHDTYTTSPTKRVVRVEVVAQVRCSYLCVSRAIADRDARICSGR